MYVPGKFLRQKILLTIFKVSVGMSLGLVLLVRYCIPVFIDGTASLAPSANQIRTLTWLFNQPVSSKYKRKNIFRSLSRLSSISLTISRFVPMVAILVMTKLMVAKNAKE